MTVEGGTKDLTFLSMGVQPIKPPLFSNHICLQCVCFACTIMCCSPRRVAWTAP